MAHILRTDRTGHRIEDIILRFDAWITPNNSRKGSRKPTESFRTIHQCDSESKGILKSHRIGTKLLTSYLYDIGSNLTCLPNPRLDNAPSHSQLATVEDSPKTTDNLTGNQIRVTELHRFSCYHQGKAHIDLTPSKASKGFPTEKLSKATESRRHPRMYECF